MPPLVVMLMMLSPTYNRCFIVDESVHILPSAIHHLFYSCLISGVGGRLFKWSLWQSDDANNARCIWSPFSVCPAVGASQSKRRTEIYCPSCDPTDPASFLWIDECWVLVCSGALLHKKIMRSWSCCSSCCCCFVSKINWFSWHTQTHWYS